MLNYLKQSLENINYLEGVYPLKQFTIGFELEAWANTYKLKNRFNDWAKKHWVEISLKDKEKSIDIDTSYMGSDMTVDPRLKRIICPLCEGEKVIPCERCDGKGKTDIKCPTCRGNGETVEGEVCPTCKGEGYINNDCPKGCEYNAELKTNVIECYRCEGEGYVRVNMSNRMEMRDLAYEWKSPVFNFSPLNIQRILSFLNKGVSAGMINTNETCGFHIHIGFPDIKTRAKDYFWILCNLALNEYKLDDITHFKGFKLHDEDDREEDEDDIYAGLSKIKGIAFRLQEIKSSELDQDLRIWEFYNDAKYEILRQHPQGTLEWRGARAFMNKGRRDDIKEFLLKKLYPFIKWMNDVLEIKELDLKNGVKIQKKDFYDILDTIPSPSADKDKQHIKRRDKKFNWDFQNPKKIGEVFNKFPWVKKLKMNNIILKTKEDLTYEFKHLAMRFEGTEMAIDKIQEQEISFENGIIEKSTLFNGLYNCVLDNVTINDGIMLNHIAHSTINNGAAYNCNIINCNINNIIANVCVFKKGCVFKKDCVIKRSTIYGSQIESGNFSKSSTEINDCNILDGIFDNSTIRDCEIFNGTFNECIILDNSKIRNGIFTNCTFESNNEIIGGNLKNCYIAFKNVINGNATFQNCSYNPKFNTWIKGRWISGAIHYDDKEYNTLIDPKTFVERKEREKNIDNYIGKENAV